MVGGMLQQTALYDRTCTYKSENLRVAIKDEEGHVTSHIRKG